MITKLIIKGAFYFYREENTILKAHFTGEFYIVDCTRYFTKTEILERYEESFFEENKEDFIDFENERYYYAEYSPYNTKNFELLSDLSELHHQEENFF